MPKVTLYHNPRCGKSRMALELLRARGIEPEIVEYLKTPFSDSDLRSLLKKLNLKPRDAIRRKEATFMEAGLDKPNLSDDDLIRAMMEHPILLERPIAVRGAKAVIGRPPETVLELL